VLTTADWPLWRDARLAALTESPHVFKSRLADWDAGGSDRWRARLAQPGAYHVVELLDGRPVGMASGLPGAELRSVWVSPSARGRGVGDRLLAAVESWARRTGETVLRLAVLPGNEPAIALYRRNGFAPTGERDGELTMAKNLHPDG